MNRKIAIFSGSRAEYGLQFPTIKAIQKHPNLEGELIVSGSHLDEDFGKTVEEIKKDGLKIHSKIKIHKNKNDAIFTPQAIASCIDGLSKVLNKIKPDIFVIYGDRFETFAACIASTQMNIPTAHIEGGDITEGGALDDSVRHAITKLSHIHFTTNEQATNRILCMGEEKWRVKTVGLPTLNLLKSGNYASKEEIFKKYSIDFERPIIIFTQHPISTENKLAKKQLLPSINSLVNLSKKNVQVIITYPNGDSGGSIMISEIKKISTINNLNIQTYKSIGRYYYQGFIALAKDSEIKIACVGNSSSGIKETPYFGCPTVNIGSRQLNRLRAENIIDVNYDEKEISSAIHKCLSDKNFRNKCRLVKNPYGKNNASIKIAKILASIDLDSEKILRKKMTIKGLRRNNIYY